MAELVRTVNFAETFAALRLGESVEFSVAEFTEPSRRPRKGCGIKRSKHFARIAQFTQYKQVMGEIAPIAVH